MQATATGIRSARSQAASRKPAWRITQGVLSKPIELSAERAADPVRHLDRASTSPSPQTSSDGGWRLGHYDYCASRYYPANAEDYSTWPLSDAWYDSNMSSGSLASTHFVIDTSRNGQVHASNSPSDSDFAVKPPGAHDALRAIALQPSSSHDCDARGRKLVQSARRRRGRAPDDLDRRGASSTPFSGSRPPVNRMASATLQAECAPGTTACTHRRAGPPLPQHKPASIRCGDATIRRPVRGFRSRPWSSRASRCRRSSRQRPAGDRRLPPAGRLP